MKIDNVVILGSTGSIGTQSIDVINTVGDKKIVGLSCDKNIEKLYRQVKETKCKNVAIFNEEKAAEFKKVIKRNGLKVKVYVGIEGLCKLSALKEADIVIISVVGMIGIKPTLSAIKAKKVICLANKETLVCEGKKIMSLVKKYNIDLRPIDSEHSAMWQCLQGERHDKIKKIILTASGGPFFGKKINDLKNVKLEDALKHPNWSMGKKITIDSATLVNKGLEVIEAHYLFDVPYDKIEVIVQRQSLIHSMVEFIDGSIKAQLGVPSMRVPIEYALYKENRKFINEKTIDWNRLSEIKIAKPDLKTFEGLALAYKAIKCGGKMPKIYNEYNEKAVKLFLENKCKFLDIPKIIKKGMNNYINKKKY